MTTAKKIEALRQKARKLGWRSPEHQAAMSEIRRLVTMAAEVEPRPPEVIASASAAAAIEHAAATSAPAASTEAEATTTDQAAELVTVDAEAEATATTAAPPHDSASATTVAETPHHASTTPSQQRGSASTTSAAGRRPPGQLVEGKSGNWRAMMYTDAAGRPAFDFAGADGHAEVRTFATGRERMAALQAMARAADANNTPQSSARHQHTPHNTHTAQSGIDAAAPARAEDVHSTAGAYPATPPAASSEQAQQTPAVPSHSDKVPQDLGHRVDAAEFERTTPQPFNVAALMADGMAPDDFVGLGIVYSGDRANASGAGAITAMEPGSMRGLKITVTLEDGRQMVCDPYSFEDHPGCRYRTNFKRHGAPYLAELAAAHLLATSNRKAAEQTAADEKARQRRELPQQWPQLKQYTPNNKLYGCTLAAANIRTLLKERFPGVKFSVRSSTYSGGDSIRIEWIDGPTTKAVDAIAQQFSAGSFNGMEDIYEYSRGVFGELFGSSKYIFSERSISNNFLSAAIAEEFPDATTRPSVEDYRKHSGALDTYRNNSAEWHLRNIRERLETMTPPRA